MNRRYYSLIIALALCAPLVHANQKDFKVKVKTKISKEQHERDVDRVALQSQKLAEKKIQRLIRKYRGKRKEPILISKLAIVQQQMASIVFRLAHSNAHHKNKRLNLTTYKKVMKRSIKTLNLLIRKYPRYEDIALAYFMRGKAYEEIDQIPQAKKDYLHLVKKFPDARESTSAYMSLAQFAIDANKHQEAISYLIPVEKRPYTAHYPFALYKLGWSYYNLDQVPRALDYVKRHIRYYQAKEKQNKGLEHSDVAILENSLKDVTTFYIRGFELGNQSYSVKYALDYYKDLEKGPMLDTMLSRYANLLRSHGLERDLQYWKDELLDKEYTREASLKVILTTLDYLHNKRRYTKIRSTTEDIVSLYQKSQSQIVHWESYRKLQDYLLNIAKEYQSLVIKNKKATRVGELSGTLASIYDTFTKVVDEEDERIPGVHYNLAETLFEIGKFESATHHYRWVVTNWDGKKTRFVKHHDVSLKAISSRYEVLKRKKLIPKKMDAVSFDENSKSAPPKVLAEWISWIDQHEDKYSKKKNSSTFENFQFEANRALYKNEKIKLSVERMVAFSTKKPKSKYAIPSASLVLDTYIKSKDWENTHKVSRTFMEFKTWKKKKFFKRLYRVASDASFKLIEKEYKQKNFEDSLDKIEDFREVYAKSERLEDVIYLGSQAALALKDEKKGEKYLSDLIKRFPKSHNTGPALLTRAEIHEKRYHFLKSTRDYHQYLKLKHTQKSISRGNVRKLKEKILLLAWLSEKPKTVRKFLSTKGFCANGIESSCRHYEAITAFREKSISPKKAFDLAIKGEKNLRPIWAATALTRQGDFAFPDRMLLVRVLAGRWRSLDPLVQAILLPSLTQSLPKAFELNRKAVQRYAKLKPSEKSINRRIRLIKEMEDTATKVMKLPWARIRATVLNEVAQLYLDLSNNLSDLPAPEGLPEAEVTAYRETIQKLVLPFEEKGQEIRGKAFEIASKNSIHESDFTRISADYFRDNPSMEKFLKGDLHIKQAVPMDMKLVHRLDDSIDWEDIISAKKAHQLEKKEKIYHMWLTAVQKQNWSRAVFLVKEIKEKKLSQERSYQLMNLVTLASSGAQAEALLELEDVGEDLPKELQPRVTYALISHSLNSLNKEKSQDLISNLEDQSSEKQILDSLKNAEEAFLVAYTTIWSKAKISAENERELLGRAAKSRFKKKVQWARKELEKRKKSVIVKKNPAVKKS